MPRYKLTLEYDGTPFNGWQVQADRPSVQGALSEAVFAFCGERVEIIGAGRTDAGVHALAQVAHVDLSREHDPFRVMSALNFHLGDEEGWRGISVLGADIAPEEFHARFSAVKRSYAYRILNRRAPAALDHLRSWHVPVPLDVKAMQAAAKYLLGHHDFTSFRDTQCQAKSPVKTLDSISIVPNGDEIVILVESRSFLHHQVRIMAGSLVQVGLGKWKPEDMKAALAAKDRASAGPTAPPHGLYLTGVGY